MEPSVSSQYYCPSWNLRLSWNGDKNDAASTFFSQMHHSSCDDGMHQASGQFGSPLGAVLPAAPELPLPLIIVTAASLNCATWHRLTISFLQLLSKIRNEFFFRKVYKVCEAGKLTPRGICSSSSSVGIFPFVAEIPNFPWRPHYYLNAVREGVVVHRRKITDL